MDLFWKIRKLSSEQIYLTKWEEPISFKNRNCFNKYYICTNGAFYSEQHLAGIGWIILEQENLKSARAAPVRATSPLQAELLAIMAGIEDASKRGCFNVLILIDSLNASLIISNMASSPENLLDPVKTCQEKI